MPSAPPAAAHKMRPIPARAEDSVGDFRRYPGARLLLSCSACSWCKPYNPERVIDRLRDLKAGGYATRLIDAARRVAWPCPACARMRWRFQFAWPPDLTEREAKRLADRYRN